MLIYSQNNQAFIKIVDSGIGIPKDQLPYVFDRFFQVDNGSTKAFDGSGIGLSLAKELVELHQGKIQVESIENQETNFIIQLPLGNAHLQDKEIIIDPKTNKTTPVSILNLPQENIINVVKNEKNTAPIVLIAEDNVDVRQYIKDALKTDFTIIEAVNGKEGLAKAKATIPDLIISDIMMPEMDGMELTNHLKTEAATSHISIIMLTARSGQTDKISGLKGGADDYLTKPFDKTELIVRINNLIQQRQRLKEKYSHSVLITSSADGLPNQSLEEKFLQSVLKMVEENMEDETFGVEELSKTIFLSRYQLHRKIKALTGKSISVFIRSIRLQHAKTLLEKGEGNVTEVAFRMGFNSVAYFSKCFLEEFGQSPSKLM